MDYSFAGAYIKALMASNLTIPSPEKPILITVPDQARSEAVSLARKLTKMGYPIFATRGTAEDLLKGGVPSVTVVRKVHETGDGADILEYLRERKIGLVINIPNPIGRASLDDEYVIRRTAVEFFVPVITRLETAKALVDSLEQNGYGSTPRTFLLEDLLAGAPLAKYV